MTVSAAPVAVSVCVASYNYRDYVRAAVDSALAQSHPRTEVVVVDDGSTDGSLELLRQYGDRIRLVEQANRGHTAAVERGFVESSGDVVVFLDADDLLDTTAVERALAVMTPTTAKVHWRLRMIDGTGTAHGVFPHRLLPLHAGDLRPLLCREGDYVGPVTSGNAYARAALAQVLPLQGPSFAGLRDGSGPDGYLNSMVPFYGTVERVDEVLGSYRSHGANHSAASGTVSLAFARWRVDHELRREAEIRRLGSLQGLRVRRHLMCSNPEHVLLRLLSLRLAPQEHVVPGDRVLPLLARVVVRGPRYSSSPPARRAFVVLVAVLCGLLPRAALPAVASWTLASRPRPRVLRLAASLLRGRSR